MVEDRVLAELSADVRRVVDRLRILSLGQLHAPAPPFGTRHAAARQTAVALAEGAQAFEQLPDPAEPAWRDVPELSPLAVGDMVAVTGHDFLAAIADAPAAQDVWTRKGRQPAHLVVRDITALVGEVRRRL